MAHKSKLLSYNKLALETFEWLRSGRYENEYLSDDESDDSNDSSDDDGSGGDGEPVKKNNVTQFSAHNDDEPMPEPSDEQELNEELSQVEILQKQLKTDQKYKHPRSYLP